MPQRHMLLRHVPSRRRPLFAAVVLTGLVVVSCSMDDADGIEPATTDLATDGPVATQPPTTDAPLEPVQADLVGTALGAGVFTTLAGYVVDAGLVEALRGGPFTVFAPPDSAFAALPDETLDAVTGDKELLTTVLTFHVVEGIYTSEQLVDGLELTTLAGLPLQVTRDGDVISVNGVEITAADVEATNGVIHVVDAVLVPPG